MGFTIYQPWILGEANVFCLIQGNYDLESTYYQDPLEPALQWSQAGAEWLHIIDLDGGQDRAAHKSTSYSRNYC